MSTASNTGQQLVRDPKTGKFGPGNRAGGRPRGSRDRHSKLRDLMTDHALAADPDTGQTRVQAALDELYTNDKEGYLRFTVKLLPRPATVPPHTAELQTSVHVNQLFALLESSRPPLPCTRDRGDAPFGSHAHTIDSSAVGESSPDGSSEAVPVPEISGSGERWVTLPGVARPVNMGMRGGDTGDVLVDILGDEQAAYVRSEWDGKGGSSEPGCPQPVQGSPPAVGDDGFVRMDDVEVVDPRDL